MDSFLFLVSLIEKENETGKRYRFLNDNRKHLIKYIWTTVPWNLLFENTTTSFKSFKLLSGPGEQFLRHLCGFDIWILQISLAEFQCLSKMMCAIMQNIHKCFLSIQNTCVEKVSRVWILTADLSAPHLRPANTNFLHYIFSTRMVSFFQIKSDSSY